MNFKDECAWRCRSVPDAGTAIRSKNFRATIGMKRSPDCASKFGHEFDNGVQCLAIIGVEPVGSTSEQNIRTVASRLRAGTRSQTRANIEKQ